ncbi:hypothetical protein CEXT_228081 [Caerostris extrusa]|uniref:Uncharacterized protein n=1 Tax=Caerostris extrusa TaxID=172846 RepID=A0AAV4TMH5_CAEEX|nr:hypothetical protein CEXT_228081 [Caerostris extrusa]
MISVVSKQLSQQRPLRIVTTAGLNQPCDRVPSNARFHSTATGAGVDIIPELHRTLRRYCLSWKMASFLEVLACVFG